jgi:pimeloyl-ACP methyl ester carboxylesterase
MARNFTEKLVHIPDGPAVVEGVLALPEGASAAVLFAHGSGSSRHSPRNNYVAGVLRDAGLGTLLMDLLTPEEDRDYRTRFDIPLLTRRLEAATRWLLAEGAPGLAVGYFGASTGAAAALQAAAQLGGQAFAVVSRGGRPDLAGDDFLPRVTAPTLLIVGGYDPEVAILNRQAFDLLRCEKELSIVPGATHLFEEPGTLEAVARLAASWFGRFRPGHSPSFAEGDA